MSTESWPTKSPLVSSSIFIRTILQKNILFMVKHGFFHSPSRSLQHLQNNLQVWIFSKKARNLNKDVKVFLILMLQNNQKPHSILLENSSQTAKLSVSSASHISPSPSILESLLSKISTFSRITWKGSYHISLFNARH